jgi:hypothetical protein
MAPDRTILHLKRLSTLNGISAVALATGIVNKTHSFINIVSIEG